MTSTAGAGRRRVAAGSLALLAVVHGACVGGVRRSFDPGPFALAAQAALAAGDLRRAESLLHEARRRTRGTDAAVHLWLATVAAMQWQSDVALRHLRVVLDLPDRAGWTEAEVRGEMGDLLFRVGRYGDSAAHLLAGSEGRAGDSRRARGELARLLPSLRKTPAVEFAELPLLQGSLPRLLCAVGPLERVFVLDTGASFSTLSRSMAGELGVDPILSAGVGTDGQGQRFPTAVGRLPTFALGDVDVGPQPVLVVDDDRLAVRDVADGFARATGALVGLDVITRFSATLDPGRGSLVLRPPGRLAEVDSQPCLWVRNRLLVPVEIEEQRLWFALDTGASASSLTEQGLGLLVGGHERAQEGFHEVLSPGGSRVSVRVVRGLVLRVSDVRFRGVDLPVLEREAQDLFPLHGVLGADLLLRCRTTLDSGRVRMEAF